MWQYSRNFTSNYYHTYGNIAAVSHLIIITQMEVLPQY